MTSNRYLVVLLVTLSLAGGASLLTRAFHTANEAPALQPSVAAVQQDVLALRQAEQQLRKLQAACDKLAQEQEQMVRDSTQLSGDHARAMRRLDELTQEVNQLCRTVAANSRVQLPTNWHQRLIDANRSVYDDIRTMLTALTEDQFPTMHTWYGDSWRGLVKPFLDHQFPTEAQRDQLIELLREISQAEQQRMAALQTEQVIPVATGASSVPAIFCLSTRWDQLQANLQSLRYY